MMLTGYKIISVQTELSKFEISEKVKFSDTKETCLKKIFERFVLGQNC